MTRTRKLAALAFAAFGTFALAAVGHSKCASAGAPVGYHHADTGYKIDIAPVGSLKAGEKGSIEIVLTADAANHFHVNEDYPIKFKAPDAGDVSFATPLIAFKKGGENPGFKFEACKEDAKTSCVLHLVVPVTPSKKGMQKVTGTFFFGVCDPKTCLNPKEAFSFDVDVK
jgi:hypothetical protein